MTIIKGKKEDRLNIAQKIIEARERWGLSQIELAHGIGIHPSVVSRWESGKSIPSLDSIKKIAVFFGLKVCELIEKNYECCGGCK